MSAATADPNPADNESSVTTPVVCPLSSADLSIEKTASAATVRQGAVLGYQLKVVDLGPSRASALVVTDTLPPGAGFVRTSAKGWACHFDSGSRTVTCTRPKQRKGAAPRITIRITAPNAAGPMTNCADVAASNPDPRPGNNESCVTTAVGGTP